jgi:serine/threonine-protein phosphatase 2A regulatory subunit B
MGSPICNLIVCCHCFQLCDLYENDSIFDKFECCLSGDGLRVATGSYGYFFSSLSTRALLEIQFVKTYFAGIIECSNIFRVFGCTSGSTEATTLEASRNPMR